MFEFDSVEMLSLACSMFITLWGLYTFMMALPEKLMLFLIFTPLVGMYTAYEKVISLFETKEEVEWEYPLEVCEEEEKLNQAYEDFKKLCWLEKDFSDEEGFINQEVLEAFDLTGVEYGVLMNENDVLAPKDLCQLCGIKTNNPECCESCEHFGSIPVEIDGVDLNGMRLPFGDPTPEDDAAERRYENELEDRASRRS